MPGSASDFRHFLHGHFVKRYPASIEILDVGAGEGTYADLLSKPLESSKAFENIDAIEAHGPYIAKYRLWEKYRFVYRGDARQLLWLPSLRPYDVIILGAILEHMTQRDAVLVLEKCQMLARCEVIVQVPFESKQGAVGGVHWEIHQQDDLTPAIMKLRYTELTPLAVNEKRGVYTCEGKYTDKPEPI